MFENLRLISEWLRLHISKTGELPHKFASRKNESIDFGRGMLLCHRIAGYSQQLAT